MNICDYIKNNENIYGLIIVNVKMKIDFFEALLTIEIDGYNAMKLKLGKHSVYYDSDSYEVGISVLVREKNMIPFFEMHDPVYPYHYALDVWESRRTS